jgi:hypothetical protein
VTIFLGKNAKVPLDPVIQNTHKTLQLLQSLSTLFNQLLSLRSCLPAGQKRRYVPHCLWWPCIRISEGPGVRYIDVIHSTGAKFTPRTYISAIKVRFLKL